MAIQKPSLVQLAEQTSKRILEAANSSECLAQLMDDCEYCAYVKGRQGRLIATNPVYDRIFGGGRSAMGRDPKSYLDAQTLSIAQASDQMIVSGSRIVDFEHPANVVAVDGGGDELPKVSCHTVKISLLGAGVPTFMCLGITQVLEPLPPDRYESMSRAWRVVSGYTERTRDLATLLAKGVSQREIAQRLGISNRTIVADRSRILSDLQIENTHALSRLLVRIQDAGYDDFGL